MRCFGIPILLAVTVIAPALSGCSLTRMAANTTADVFDQAAPAFDEHWDYELAGQAAPGGIMQLEGVLRVVPDNEQVLFNLSRSYASYAYGYVEDEIERNDPMDFEREDHLRHRARLMYLRARNLMFRLIELRKGGFEEARASGLEPLEQWLARECQEPEDAAMLLWAGYAWASAINVSRDDPELIADLGMARAVIERSVELDDTYYFAAGLTALATLKADFPEALGGDPEGGRELFERALELTDRNFLLIQLNYAMTYAVKTENRELFDSLLDEIVQAGDISPQARLANKIARRRAYRLRQRAPDLFF